MGFQPVWALASHRRAEAIDDAEVCQKPLFPVVRASLDLFKSGSRSGVW